MPTTFNDPNFKVFINDVELRGVTSVSKFISFDSKPDLYTLEGIHIKSESGFDTTPYIVNSLVSNDVLRYSLTLDVNEFKTPDGILHLSSKPQLKLYSIAYGAFRFKDDKIERPVVVETLSCAEATEDSEIFDLDITYELSCMCEHSFKPDQGYTGHWSEFSEVSEFYLNEVRDGRI